MAEQYEVEAIRGHKPPSASRWKVKFYTVKWKNYDDCENTDEPKQSLEAQVPDMVDRYWIEVNRQRKEGKNKKPPGTQSVSRKSIGKSRGKSTAAGDIDSELLSVETKKIGRSVPDSEIKQEAVVLDSGDEGASVDVEDEVSVKTDSCDTGINSSFRSATSRSVLLAPTVKKEVKVEAETEPNLPKRRRQRQKLQISYREDHNSGEEFDGMDDEDADADFEPASGNRVLSRKIRDGGDSSASEDLENDIETDVVGLIKSGPDYATSPKSLEPGNCSHDMDVSSDEDEEADKENTTFEFKKPVENPPCKIKPLNAHNKGGFQAHKRCTNCDKQLTSAEIANPHSADLAPFQARMNDLVKERKKYQKILDDLKRAKLSDKLSEKNDESRT